MQMINKLFSTPNLVALLTGLLLFSLAPQQPIHERFSMLERVAPAVVLLLAVLYVRKQVIKNWLIPIPIVLLLVVMAVSIVQMPAFFIVKDFLAFALLTVFAIIAVSAVGTMPAVNGAFISILLLILTTSFYALFLPLAALDEYGQLKGAFYGANSLALSLVLLSPALCVVKIGTKLSTLVIRSLMLGIVFTVIYFSTSRTSLVVFIMMLLTWGLFRILQKNQKAGLIAFASTLICLILIAINWNSITAALGKSSDLSGRFPLWGVYLDAISLKSMQGYGWHIRTTPDMPLGNIILKATGFPQINANNDLINWWALTGIFGAVIALISVMYLIINGVKLRHVSTTSSWIFLTGIILLMGGLTELSTMHPDGWMLLSLAFTSSAQALPLSKHKLKRVISTGSLVLQ